VQQLSLLAPQLVRPLLLERQLEPVFVEPAQEPPLHMFVAQAEGAPHCPFAPQTSTPLPAQR
jgi:hypothetical protein